MVRKVPLVVERPRRFPAAVEIELERRRRRLLGRATGRVLDLDLAEHRAEVARASGERHVVPAYDTALVVGQMARFPDLVLALRAIDRLVSPDGQLLLVEPTGRPGLGALLVASAWAATPRLRGFHVARDLTAALRRTTFALDDIERFSMPTAVSPLRQGVEVHAVRVPAPAAAAVAVAVEATS